MAGTPRICPGCRSRDGAHTYDETCTLRTESWMLEQAMASYQRFGDEHGWKDDLGRPIPPWEELPEYLKGKWMEAARNMKVIRT